MGTYIDESAILWLCENENPAVKHLSKKEFFAGEPTDADYREMSRYVSFIHKNNCSTKNRFDSTFGQAAFLCFAAECGMRCDDEPLAGLIDSLIRKSLTESGGFSPDWKPLRPCAAWSASILKALLRSGYTGKEVHSCAQWLAEIQLKDGGWNTNPSAGFFPMLNLLFFQKSGCANEGKTAASLIATACTTEALLMYSNIFGRYGENARRGTLLLLDKISTDIPKIESSGIYVNREPEKLGYPLIMQTDPAHILLIIKKAGMINDGRTSKLFNHLVSKMNKENRFCLETKQNGMLHRLTGGKLNSPDKWCTLNVYRLINEL